MRKSFFFACFASMAGLSLVGLAACGDDGSSLSIPLDGSADANIAPFDGGSAPVDSSTSTFTLGGAISGYGGSGLVLENGTDTVTVPKDATTYTLPAKLTAGAAYNVKVKTDPTSPSQTCVVANGAGTIGGNVTNANVTCTTNTYPVSVTVNGLKGAGLVLQNNAADDLLFDVPDGGGVNKTFATQVNSGAAYAVTVKTQPAEQTCTVAGGTGTVVAGPITTVTVNCTNKTYTIGGTVAGLAGSGLVLQNNAGDDATINANGTFAFPTAHETAQPYAVTIKSQPTAPWQTCTLANDAGTIAGANVTNVAVTCTTNTYAIAATVSGLAGSGLVLQNNAGDDVPVAVNGTVTFATRVASGQPYLVSALTQPTNPWQTCTAAASGAVAGSDVTVPVSCVTNTYTVGGTVSGLSGGSVVLQNNGGNDLTVSADGPFTFGTPVPSGGAYVATVLQQPAGRTCIVSAGAGTVTNANVSNLSVECFPMQIFSYTGGTQTFTVPAGVTQVTIEAFGAQGNSNAGSVAGAQGGYAKGVLAVTPGQVLTVMVGGGGAIAAAAGFNGGAAAGNSACGGAIGGGGGGASDVRVGAAALADRVIVAGGGGGAAGQRVAGCGRGTGGGGGGGYYGGGGGAGWPYTSVVVPTGGTQSAGGGAGNSDWAIPGNDGSPGGLGIGGAGGVEAASDQAASTSAAASSGIGGGAIGGSGNYGGTFVGQSGAGGSGYIGGVTSGTMSSGTHSGSGQVTIHY